MLVTLNITGIMGPHPDAGSKRYRHDIDWIQRRKLRLVTWVTLVMLGIQLKSVSSC